jgi:AhpD family alkylhydroperoxidase
VGARLAQVTLRGTLAQIRHVSPVHPDRARGLVAEVYGQVQRDFGMLAPPIVLHSPAPGPLAAAWLILRESLIASGRAGRAAKEAVAAAVSLANTCPYCVAVHTIALRALARPGIGAAIAAGRVAEVADPDLRAIAEWARDSGTRAGAARTGLPVPPRAAPELVAVAVTFHYLNRMVNVFLTDSLVPPGVPAAIRAGVPRLAGWLLAPIVRRPREPGAALRLLPPAPLPPEWSWAARNRRLADAFGRAYAAIEAAGTRVVPVAVRDLVRTRLRDWDGLPFGPSRGWVADAVAPLPPDERATGRLALLTAFASYQVDRAVIDEYRGCGGDDAGLVGVASWAALTAAGHVGTWLDAQPRQPAGGPSPR